VIFPSNIIKTPSPQETEHEKREKRASRVSSNKKKKELQESLQTKREVNILRG
jgi:hypothetical protein